MNIVENLQNLKTTLSKEITLVAVSKTKPISEILAVYNTGHRVFGENKIQEMTEKWEELPKDIQWHMIGHVQRNKVKYMAAYVHLIHSVDSLKLLSEINKQATKHNRVINCLLQLHIAREDAKFGMTKNEAATLLASEEIERMENIKIVGLMGMATFTDDKNQIAKEFQYLKAVFDEFSQLYPDFSTLSMGMSSDYELAIDCGSTMIRIGNRIFGERN